MPLGPFLGALGQMFSGVAKDQDIANQNDARDQAQQARAQQLAQAAQLHQAQMAEYQAQASQRQQQAAFQAKRQQTLAQYGKAAMQGDPDAIAQVVSVAPELASTLTKEGPAGQYDPERGVIVDPRKGTATPVANLPPKPAAPDTKEHWMPAGTDPDTGKPLLLNTATGETKVGGGVRPQGLSALSNVANSRLAVAAQQAQTADQIMSAFEDKVLSGGGAISTPGSALAKIALSGGPVASTAAETMLNKSNPELAQYVRAAKAMAASERLISPRGGSNSLMQAEAMLSAAGPAATAPLIQQARGYRQALVQGLAQHAAPQAQFSGVPLAPGGGKPPLAQRVQQLQAAHLSKEAARAQLLKEGYDLSGGD